MSDVDHWRSKFEDAERRRAGERQARYHQAEENNRLHEALSFLDTALLAITDDQPLGMHGAESLRGYIASALREDKPWATRTTTRCVSRGIGVLTDTATGCRAP